MSTAYRFSPGLTVVTADALVALNEAGVSALDLLLRHLAGDWGAMSPQMQRYNEQHLEHGAALFSKYVLPTSLTVWVVTHADRTQTRVLLPGGDPRPQKDGA